MKLKTRILVQLIKKSITPIHKLNRKYTQTAALSFKKVYTRSDLWGRCRALAHHLPLTTAPEEGQAKDRKRSDTPLVRIAPAELPIG